jgi:hypothetical protein
VYNHLYIYLSNMPKSHPIISYWLISVNRSLLSHSFRVYTGTCHDYLHFHRTIPNRVLFNVRIHHSLSLSLSLSFSLSLSLLVYLSVTLCLCILVCQLLCRFVTSLYLCLSLSLSPYTCIVTSFWNWLSYTLNTVRQGHELRFELIYCNVGTYLMGNKEGKL